MGPPVSCPYPRKFNILSHYPKVLKRNLTSLKTKAFLFVKKESPALHGILSLITSERHWNHSATPSPCWVLKNNYNREAWVKIKSQFLNTRTKCAIQRMRKSMDADGQMTVSSPFAIPAHHSIVSTPLQQSFFGCFLNGYLSFHQIVFHHFVWYH